MESHLIVVVKIMFCYSGFTRLRRVGLSAKILFIRCLMPDSGYQIQDHRIARAAQALAPRVALSFYIKAKTIACNKVRYKACGN